MKRRLSLMMYSELDELIYPLSYLPTLAYTHLDNLSRYLSLNRLSN